MTSTRSKQTDANDVGYAGLRKQLDDIVGKLQDPDCDVDQAAELYGQAMQAIGRLEAYLQTAENRVRTVQADLDGDGAAG